MEKTALRTIEKYNMISAGDIIIAGISGGADSMSLLFFLYGLIESMNIKITAVHINHGLRGKEADEDEKYVIDVCRKLNINTEIKSVILKAEAKKLSMTEEEAGRKIRYEAFYEAAKKYKANKIAVAHNMDDNAETVLMRMLRGTGIKGLGGISPKRGMIIRPLIECSREIIEEYAHKKNIKFRTDSTNAEEIYSRNKIRLKLMPWIKENFNKNINAVILRNSEIIRQENDYLDDIAFKALEEVKISDDENGLRLDCGKLEALSNVILRRTIRLACLKFSEDLHDISIMHIEKIISLIHKQSGKKINGIPNNITAERYNNVIRIGYETKSNNFYSKLEFGKITVLGKMKFLISDKKNDEFKNIYAVYADSAEIKAKLAVRSRMSGDRIFIKNLGHKKIKDFFIDKKIPLPLRNTIPLVALGNNILCICGYRTGDKENDNFETFYIHFDNI